MVLLFIVETILKGLYDFVLRLVNVLFSYLNQCYNFYSCTNETKKVCEVKFRFYPNLVFNNPQYPRLSHAWVDSLQKHKS